MNKVTSRKLNPNFSEVLKASKVKPLRTFVLVAGYFLAVLTPINRAQAEIAAVELHSFKTHSRLVFKVDEGTTPVWKDLPGGFEIHFKGMALADLGAPLGNEKEFSKLIQKEIEGKSDTRLASLKIVELTDSVKVTGKWLFGKGDQAPAQPEMKKFVFRQKDPPRYVIDFWAKPGLTLAEAKSRDKRNKRQAELQRIDDEAKARKQRELASQRARFEIEDVTRFCRQPLSDEQDIFMAFGPVHDRLNLNKWFSSTTPDSGYAYLDPQGDEKDAQYVRLALSLYRSGNPALAIRTLDFFDAEHPKSAFKEEMRFLRANALIKLGIEEEANRILGELIINTRDAPAALHAAIFLSVKQTHQGQFLAALENFLWLIQRYPEHRLNWLFHLAAAENLFNLKQTDRAEKEYLWVAEHAQDRMNRADAAFRIGDLSMSRRQYPEALSGYYQQTARFKKESIKFPNLMLNRAESLYWLKQYDQAEEAFTAYLHAYPAHPAGWRATFRLGELYGRRSGLEAQATARKWFYETINRYPYSPGTVLARTRLTPCDDHGGMDAESAERFFLTEATKFEGGLIPDGATEVFMERYRDFKGLAYVRTLLTFGKEDQAVDVAIRELEGNSKSEAKNIMGETLTAVFRKSVLRHLAEGKKFAALTFYQDRVASLPKSDGTGDPAQYDYMLKLSQAASELGLGALAQGLMQNYHELTTPDRSERRPASGSQKPGSTEAKADDLELRLRSSEKAFTEAKALWVSKKTKEEKAIRELLSKVVEESEYSLYKEILLALIDEKSDKVASALQHGIRAQLLVPRDALSSKLESQRVDYWVGTLQEKAGDPKVAVELYRKLEDSLPIAKHPSVKPSGAPGDLSTSTSAENASEVAHESVHEKPETHDSARERRFDHLTLLGVPGLPTREALLLNEGEILARQNRWGEAARAFSIAMDESLGGNQAAYEFADALGKSSKMDDKTKAHAVLEKVANSSKKDFWRRLARQSLNLKDDAKEGGNE